MFNKEFKLGEKIVKILFTHKPFYEDENKIVMGFPYNMNPETFNETQADEIKGYYTCIKYENNKLTVINDILAGYRTYYAEINNILYLSNDYLKIFNLVDKSKRIPDKMAIEYWRKHRMLAGEETFVNNIKKFLPAHIYTFTETAIEKKLYFKDIVNKPDRIKHKEEILNDLRQTVSLIKDMPQKKFLLFSGGADSTLCVKLLQEQGVEFTPVFAKHIPTNTMNFDDILKVRYATDKLKISPVEIEVDTTENIEDDVVNIMFTDRNITQLFFKITSTLKEMYGDDILLINGQNSDYVFGFGPTERTFNRKFVRSLLYNVFPRYINTGIYSLIVLFKPEYRKYRIYNNIQEYFQAFLDEVHYIPLIDKSIKTEYLSWLNKIIDMVSQYLKSVRAICMYLKIIAFMQGSDNYVNVQAPEYEGYHSVFLFTTPGIVYSTIKNTDYRYEVFHPKSVIYEILQKDFHYKMPNIKAEKNYSKNMKQEMTYRDYEKKTDKYFYDKINSLDFSEKVRL